MRRSVAMAFVLLCIGTNLLYSQDARLSLDPTKPFVYIVFDHAGKRPPVEKGEPGRGYWLRLVNNSIFPIEVQSMDTSTQPELVILPDVIRPRVRTIPRSGLAPADVPQGYTTSFGGGDIIEPGKDLVFSVPENHVGFTWYMEVPFRFSLPTIKNGMQPTCYAPFFLEDVPREFRRDVQGS